MRRRELPEQEGRDHVRHLLSWWLLPVGRLPGPAVRCRLLWKLHGPRLTSWLPRLPPGSRVLARRKSAHAVRRWHRRPKWELWRVRSV